MRPDDLPVSTHVELATLLTEWDFARHAPLLREKVDQLSALRIRVVPGLAGLVEDYRQVLVGYLKQRAPTPVEAPRQGGSPDDSPSLMQETLKRLATLDALRARLRQPPARPPAVAAPAPERPLAGVSSAAR